MEANRWCGEDEDDKDSVRDTVAAGEVREVEVEACAPDEKLLPKISSWLCTLRWARSSLAVVLCWGGGVMAATAASGGWRGGAGWVATPVDHLAQNGLDLGGDETLWRSAPLKWRHACVDRR